MADPKKPKLTFSYFRRSSTASSAKSTASSSNSVVDGKRNRSRTSLLPRNKSKPVTGLVYREEPVNDQAPQLPAITPSSELPLPAYDLETPGTSIGTARTTPFEKPNPVLTLEEPTPDLLALSKNAGTLDKPLPSSSIENRADTGVENVSQRPDIGRRRQSLAHSSQARFLNTLLESERPRSREGPVDYFGPSATLSASMLHRKIWVKRPGASATLVSINEDDLVDDVRDMILRKYANSLGRNFDSPDVTLRIIPRNHINRASHQERTLGPEEPISRTLDAYYPGGQTVEEALLIDVPQRRTPKQSPRGHMPYYLADDTRPGESGTDYFPLMPPGGAQSPHLPSNVSHTSGHSAHSQTGSHHPPLHAISVLSTGQVPPLPSPGSRGPRHSHRPKYGRTHTSSPTTLHSSIGNQNDASKSHTNAPPPPPAIPTPPAVSETQTQRPGTPPPRVSSPRPKVMASRRSRKAVDHPKLPAGLLDGSVPPINVLIVEDNIINLKLLEAFMKRLKVRWHTAMNGREAVTKWRTGGFHLVLMDIQLPVMNGLEATKEIRRLEKANRVGVFCSSGANSPINALVRIPSGTENGTVEPKEEDLLTNAELFKSSVIIVALTASSLQSDRHEALAAGCNDFLTKPVNFIWLERKVMEWGCMQALIDFDGWRKWKSLPQAAPATKNQNTSAVSMNSKSSSRTGGTASKVAKGKSSATGAPIKREKRGSLGANSLSGISSGVSSASGNGSGNGSESLEGNGGSGKAIAAGA